MSELWMAMEFGASSVVVYFLTCVVLRWACKSLR